MSESDHLQEFKNIMDEAHVDSESKFTPGPWHVGRGHELSTGMKGWEYYPVCWSKDDENVCDIVYNREDAELIAAAPEMYEMLASIRTTLKDMGYLPYLVKDIDLILRKARGESEVSE